jgi:hypothetical protein
VTLQVVGAGLGRTGTHSLKLSLEQLLGGRCHHMIEVFGNEAERDVWRRACLGDPTDFTALLDPYVASTDLPGCLFWRELVDANADALVLLSVRTTSEEWWRSASHTILPSIRMVTDEGDPWMCALLQKMAVYFSDELEDRDAMVAAYERHNDEVRSGVPAERLLEWYPSDGWAPICDRLGLPVPEGPFPRTNSTEDFRAMAGFPPLEG